MAHQQQRFPTVRFLIPGGAVVVTVLMFVCQQWLQAQPWWPKLPWLEFSALAFFFLGGVVYGDLLNRRSSLRRWWAERSSVFDPTFHAASTVINGVDLNTPYFSLRFIKSIDDTGIELAVTSYAQFKPIRSRQVVLKLPAQNYSAGEIVRVPVAVIPRQDGPHPGYWANDPNSRVIGQTGNLVEVYAVVGRAVLQTYRVFISVGEGMAATNNRYHYLLEERDVFEAGSR